MLAEGEEEKEEEVDEEEDSVEDGEGLDAVELSIERVGGDYFKVGVMLAARLQV